MNPATQDLVSVTEEGQRLSEQLLEVVTLARRREGSHAHVLNAVELAALLHFELNTSLRALALARPGLETRFHARTLVLAVFEWLGTMKSLLAKNFRSEFVEAMGNDLELDRRLKTVHSDVNRLYQDCSSRFKALRDGLAALRDDDPEVRLTLLGAVDRDEAIGLANETLKVLIPFHREIFGYVQRISRQ